MTKTTIELLQEAREWLSVEEHWCQNFQWNEGRNCALGAIERAMYPETSGENDLPIGLAAHSGALLRLAEAAEILVPELTDRRAAFFGIAEWLAPYWKVTTLNDKYGYVFVCHMFDLAIRREQEKIDRQAKKLVESSELVPVLTAK